MEVYPGFIIFNIMFIFKDIQTYHVQLKNKETDCVSVVKHYLDIINANTDLNAFVEVYENDVIDLALKLDNDRKAGKPIKKLHGVVIAIKDVLCFKNKKITAASKILQNVESLYTASALQFLIDEDAIIIGSCNCDEFAMGSSSENSYYGKVLNPVDKTRVPGGSSGGSAVAVKAGMCMASLGSDTGGSVRQPADFCGVIGCKPGYGTISRNGLIAYASSFDQIGVFANSITDTELLLSVLALNDEMDSTMHQVPLAGNAKSAPYSFCYFKQMLDHPALDEEISKSIYKEIDKLKSKGHTVTALDFSLIDYIVPAYYVLTTAEASSNLSRYDGIRYGPQSSADYSNLAAFYSNNRSEGFGTEVKRRIMLGTFVLSTGYFDAFYNKALQIRKLLVEQVDEIFSQYDAILSPVSPTTAFEIGEKTKDATIMYLADIFTVFANLTGIAAISLPLFTHSNNLPFGLQTMTRNGDERNLLSISEMLLNN